MGDGSEKRRSKIMRFWDGLGTTTRALLGVAAVLSIIGSVFAVGWASHDRWAEQAQIPGRVDSLETYVFGREIPSRLRAVESEVEDVRATQKRRRKRLESIRGDLERLTSLAERILCRVENPDSSCIDPDGSGDSGDDP